MGEKLGVVGLLFVALGCDGASTAEAYPRGPDDAGDPGMGAGGTGGLGGSGAGGTSVGGSGKGGTSTGGTGGSGTGGGASGAGGAEPDDSPTWIWTACGTIPSTLVESLTRCEPGDAVTGGHPFAEGDNASVWRITGLAMSADGRTLVSMGGVTLVWDVEADFSASRATCIEGAAPELPKVDISPDGRWIAIAGDGRRVVSRSGSETAYFENVLETSDPCFPNELRFSPDGQWLAGAGWEGEIDVFRTADLEAIAPEGSATLEPSGSLPVTCGPPSEPTSGIGSSMRSAFTPDGLTIVTEVGDRYRVGDWEPLVQTGLDPAPHFQRGGFEVSPQGGLLVSDCSYVPDLRSYDCGSHAAPFPKFSPEGRWIVAGATLTHVASGEKRVLDAMALVGIFAPNGDVIAAGADNTLTRYCKNP